MYSVYPCVCHFVSLLKHKYGSRHLLVCVGTSFREKGSLCSSGAQQAKPCASHVQDNPHDEQYLDPPVVRDETVGALEVSMLHSILVQVLHSRCCVNQQAVLHRRRHVLPLRVVVQDLL